MTILVGGGTIGTLSSMNRFMMEGIQDRESLLENLKTLIQNHWDAMESRRSDTGRSWNSYRRIQRAVGALGDSDAGKFMKDDNYAHVQPEDPNFGLSGLPAVIYLSEKYGFPIDQERYARLQAQHRAQQEETLREAKAHQGHMHK